MIFVVKRAGHREPTPKMYVAGSFHLFGGRIEPSKLVHPGHGLLGFEDCLAGF